MKFFNPFKNKGVGKKVIFLGSSSPVVASEVRKHDDRIQKLEETMGSLKPPHDHAEHLDKSRAKIAFFFVRWYFVLIFAVVIGVPLYAAWTGNAQPIELNQTLTQVATLLGTPLGFVVGYYFKDDRKK